jgi:radical SAM superfamily enzyme YgiQ (UPF0313 family)
VITKLVREGNTSPPRAGVQHSGWTSLKMYFMVGQPTETLADVQGIVDLGWKVKQIGRKYIGNRARVRSVLPTSFLSRTRPSSGARR